jgi:amidase
MLDMNCVGPMGRTVDDVALVFGLIAGGDGIDPFVGPATISELDAVDSRSLRVGFYTRDGVWAPTHETQEAVRKAADALASAGAQVEEVAPPSLEEATDLFFRMMAADGGARARADLAPAGGRHMEQMLFVLEMTREYAVSAEEFFGLMSRWSAFRERLQRFVGEYDVVISPVTPGPAPLHGCIPGDDTPLETYLPWANVQAHSIGGLPVVVVPTHTERCLPLGVQVAASAFHDHLALAAARIIEERLGGYARITAELLSLT